jgi:hypothetical protein
VALSSKWTFKDIAGTVGSREMAEIVAATNLKEYLTPF